MRRKTKFLGLLDANKIAMPGDDLHHEMIHSGFRLVYRVFGNRILHYESETAIILVFRPLCRFSDSRTFVSIQENIAGCMVIDFLASIVRYVQGGSADAYTRGRPNALTAGAVFEQVVQVVVGKHLGKRVAAAMARNVLVDNVNACVENGLGKLSSRHISQRMRGRALLGQDFHYVLRPVDRNVFYRALHLTSYATSAGISQHARQLHQHFSRTIKPTVQNKSKLITVRWGIFLNDWIAQGSKLHRVLTRAYQEEIRSSSGNPNPRSDYNQEETNDDFRTMLDQNGQPFWLPVDGTIDRSGSPYNPSSYPVLRQLVHNSVKQRTKEYKAPEGNTGRTQLADRNFTIKLAHYGKPKQISNGFVLCHFVPRDDANGNPAWTTSLTKAELQKEFDDIKALAVQGDVNTATHFYLREKSPKTQVEEDVRPEGGELFFWKMFAGNVKSRLTVKRVSHLSLQKVGRGDKDNSNGFRLYWMQHV